MTINPNDDTLPQSLRAVAEDEPFEATLTPADKRKALYDAGTRIINSQWGGYSKAEKRRLNWKNSKLKIAERQAKLQAPKPPKQMAEARGVYVIGAPGHPVKIGIASNVRSRLHSIQTGCPERLRIYVFVEGLGDLARDVEVECHKRLGQHRLTGEWFQVEWRDAVSLVRQVTADLLAPVKIDQGRLGI